MTRSSNGPQKSRLRRRRPTETQRETKDTKEILGGNSHCPITRPQGHDRTSRRYGTAAGREGGRRGGDIRIDRPDDITSKLLLRKRNISPSPTDRQLKTGLLELSIIWHTELSNISGFFFCVLVGSGGIRRFMLM